MILLDSNIVIYAAEPEYKKLRKWLQSQFLFISDLTKLEVLGYHRITDDQFIWFTGFFDSIQSFPISNDIIEVAIPLRRSYKMSLGDSIIAATALEHNLELCTNNRNDFQNVDNLKMVDTGKYF